MAISRELNDTLIVAISLNTLGELARAQNDFAAARPLYEETLALSRKLGNKEGIIHNLNNLGAVLLHEGDVEGANEYYAEALTMAQEMGHKAVISYSLDGFAAIAAKSKDAERSIKLASAAETLRHSIGCKIEPTDRLFRETYLSDLRAATSEQDFAEFYSQGEKLKLEEAVALAEERSQSNPS